MVGIRKHPKYVEWFSTLRDPLPRKRIEARLFRLAMGNAGDHRVLLHGVVEMRLDFGPGYRVYYTVRQGVVVVLLCGGDKSSQQRDIALAYELAKDLE